MRLGRGASFLGLFDQRDYNPDCNYDQRHDNQRGLTVDAFIVAVVIVPIAHLFYDHKL